MLRLLRAAERSRAQEREPKSENTSDCFHPGFGQSACTRLTLMRPFVKTRSVWRSKWTLIIIALIAVVVRLLEIEQPFIDRWSWRQSDVAAIARNYLENGFHFGRPQIDWAGNAPGYVGTEFPILPLAAALSYKITGVQEWVGRIQGVLFFAASLPFFFLLVRRVFGEVAAVWATFFHAFAPLSVVASRAFMPDVPSLSLALIGLYCLLVWVEENALPFFIASAVLISLALLIKLPTAVIGVPLLYLAQGGAVSKPPFIQSATWKPPTP
jgi:4-amino-4-deoxy-L-arabinose transferase-like glycosyltransferase